jgi:NitT/TauT family transport system substrate-binding protein
MSQYELAAAAARSRFTPARVVLAGALVVGLATACGGSTPAATGSSSNGNPLAGKRFIMMAQGSAQANRVVEHHAVELLKKQGAKAEMRYNDGKTNVAIAQLQSGDIDVYSEAMAAGIGAVAAGIPLVNFAVGQPRQDYVFLARKGINTLADLKGQKIGVQDTTGVNYAQALLVLQKAGLNVKDVDIVPTGGQSVRLAALLSGRVDATMLSHKAQITLQGRGFTTLFDYTKEAPELYDDSLFSTRKWLTSNEPLAVAVNKALLESYVWFSDKGNAEEVVSEALTIEPQADKATLTSLFDLLRTAGAYPAGTILDKAAIAAQQDLYVKTGAVTKAVPVDQWVDTSYAGKAKAQVK